MLNAKYYTFAGEAGETVTLPDDPFDGIVHEEVLHQAVKAYLANQRQGTASAKNRSEVAGSGRKMWRQKGTGRARQGTAQAPHWRGGGLAFPPRPRSFRQQLPRKVRMLARRSAFNARALNDRVLVVDSFAGIEAPRTKDLVGFFEAAGIAGSKVLVLTNGVHRMAYLSGRNLPSVQVMPYADASAYEVLKADYLVIEEAALQQPAMATEEEATDA
jgi:large subunit ribosomal protein L4